ncbi:glycoside hydrolase family 3 C-terminal domain-containing protein [Actinomadura kijaniata]|uniref:Beta-glucosidase n=1 Tax=Actinomadura namibiensis TaxID=182080 RepID=A0A7W3LJK1_ACTNM|nr:glycoside hydrolase family 3 C-terminal domain-containing protein [Actinomadura namibiensis]MBA8949280.1 beta-glucosidase [Actinomadura namibiensis]
MSIDEADLRKRLAELTLEEKVTLLTGADFWTLPPIERIGLKKIVMSDGPSGVRGTRWDERETSLLFPSPTSLGATWDVAAAERTGRLNGAQARDKGVHVHLAPTINIHRTPLGGRHFENYAEDPLLVARIGAGFVRGVQSTGVASTVKHYVGNDSETERNAYDAVIDETTLEEIYLRPFRETVSAGAWAVMAAYNKVNGPTMTEHEGLLTDVLKNRWGFDGIVVSDWFAISSTVESANGGMDVEMPGTPGARWRDRLVAAVREGKVAEELVDDKVLRVLRLAARTGALEGYSAPAGITTPADARDQLRELAARSMVVLRNEGGLLPLASPRRVALIGPNVRRFGSQGGGSAHVNPADLVLPEQGLREVLGDGAELSVHAGVHPHERLAELPVAICADPRTGERGVRVDHLGADGEVLLSELRRATKLMFLEGLPEGTARIRVTAEVTAPASGVHTFGVAGTGAYTLTIGGERHEISLALDGDDPFMAFLAPPEHRVETAIEAGATVPLELVCSIAEGPLGLSTFTLGYFDPHLPEDEELAAAVAAARDADVAIVLVGTNDEVESEGFDRTTLALPGRQDELVAAVAAAQPATVVVVNAGSPVLMPWRDEVPALLWAWLPGQEGGGAIADVLAGRREPGGRLPTTFPATEEGILLPWPKDGVLEYSEGAAIGYRHYAADDVAFPFGHGLGYTTWEYEALTVSGGVAEVTIRNAGGRDGREVVQVYAHGPDVPVRLAGFATVDVPAGGHATVRVELDGALPEGATRVRAGRSVADLRLEAARS